MISNGGSFLLTKTEGPKQHLLEVFQICFRTTAGTVRYCIATQFIDVKWCYKTTSQNVSCHLRQQLRIFLFCRKIMFYSQDIRVFVFSTNIPWFTESVTLRWVLVHETRYIFEYIFWTTTHEVTKLDHPIDRYKQGQSFSVIFWTIWRTGARFQIIFHLGACPNYSITNYVNITVFHFFEKVNKLQLKMVNINH